MPLLNKPLVSSANFQRTEQEIASLQKEVATNAATSTSSNSVPAPSVPLPCTGGTFEGSHGFVIAAQVDKKGEFDTFCAIVPAGCTRLGTLLGKTSDQGVRDNTIFHWVDVPDDFAATGGHFEYMFPLNLRYNTTYGLIQLVAVVEDPVTGLTGRKKNPPKPWNAQTQQYSYLDMWTTGNALNAPGTPNCATDIIENVTYNDRDGGHARLTLRAYFAANRTSTAAQMEATKIGVRLKYVAGGGFLQASAPATLDTDTFEDITISDVPEGQQLLWQDVWTKHGTGRAFSGVANCPITAGGVDISLADFITMVNGATITFAAVDAKHSAATVTYTQPTPNPFAIKKLQILRSIDGGATYQVEEAADRPIAEGVTTSGVHSVVYNVKTKVAVGSLWKIRMLARPGLDWTGPAFTNNGLADPTGDSGPATAVQNFTAHWEAKAVTYKWQPPPQNATSIQYYNLWITNTAGTQFMQVLSDGMTKAGQLAPTQTKQGSLVQAPKHKLGEAMKLRNLDPAFSATFRVHVTGVNIVNGAVTEGAEAFFDVIPGNDFIDSNDAVNVTSAGQSVFSTRNELFNGHFHYSRGTGQVCRHWSFNRAGGNWILPLPSGTGLEFDLANHRLHWYGLGGGLPVQQLGDPTQQTPGYNVDAGDFKTVSFVLYSFNAQHTLSLQVAIRDFFGSPIAVVPFSALVNSTPTVYQVKFQIPVSQTFPSGGSFYLQFEDPGGDISNLSDLLIDVVGMNGGQRYTGYAVNPNDTNNAGAQIWDGSPVATGVLTSPPVSPTGPPQGTFTQGGEPSIGFGGSPKFFQ